MISKWGYSLAHTPTAKAYRPSLRAATETSLIQVYLLLGKICQQQIQHHPIPNFGLM